MIQERVASIRRALARMIDPSSEQPEITIRGATVVDKQTHQIFGGEGTTTILKGSDVFVGVRIKAEDIIISPPDRR